MAIYHTRIKTFSRAKGHSSTAAAAYRAGLLLTDERTGLRHDYRRRGGVVATRCIVPNDAPDWALAPPQLWAAAEAAERRKDATVAREFEIALPHELTDNQRADLVWSLGRALVDRYGFAVQASIHSPDTPDGLNHHAHILATTRRVGEHGLHEKTRELDGGASGRLEVEWTREMVALIINAHLEAAQVDARVDHRSLEAQADAAMERGDLATALALTRQPTQHVGKDATALERRGEETGRVDTNGDIQDGNEEAFDALLAKFEGEGRAMPLPDRFSLANARRDRRRENALSLSSVPGEGMAQGLRGFGPKPLEVAPTLSTREGRERAAQVALDQAGKLWDYGRVDQADVTLITTRLVMEHRRALMTTYVHDASFATYVRELLRLFKRMMNDAARWARRNKALATARMLLHRAQRALEHFDSAHPQPGDWSQAEWSKRRTRRVSLVQERTKAVQEALANVSPAAEAQCVADAQVSAKLVEDWSIVVLKRYPLNVDRASTGAALLLDIPQPQGPEVVPPAPDPTIVVRRPQPGM